MDDGKENGNYEKDLWGLYIYIYIWLIQGLGMKKYNACQHMEISQN